MMRKELMAAVAAWKRGEAVLWDGLTAEEQRSLRTLMESGVGEKISRRYNAGVNMPWDWQVVTQATLGA